MDIAETGISKGVLARLFQWCSDAWEQAGEAEMLANLDERVFHDLARDCGVTPDQLLQLVKAGPHAADEMPEMMRALNIDPAAVKLQDALLFRDMQVTCGNCAAKGRCRNDLALNTAGAHFRDYCGNAPTLNALRAEPELLIG